MFGGNKWLIPYGGISSLLWNVLAAVKGNKLSGMDIGMSKLLRYIRGLTRFLVGGAPWIEISCTSKAVSPERSLSSGSCESVWCSKCVSSMVVIEVSAHRLNCISVQPVSRLRAHQVCKAFINSRILTFYNEGKRTAWFIKKIYLEDRCLAFLINYRRWFGHSTWQR